MGLPSIYLATPFGFSSTQRDYLLPVFISTLQGLGNLRVHEPFAENEKKGLGPAAKRKNKDWAFAIGDANREAMRECDAVFAVVNGVPPDEGVCAELGIAIALAKPVFLYRDDYRRAANSDTLPLNLMVFSGMSATTWEEHYYTSLGDLRNPKKALAKWIKSVAPQMMVTHPSVTAESAGLAQRDPVQTRAEKAAKRVQEKGLPLDEVYKVFSQFDTDSSGIISAQELEAMFVKLCNGKKVSQEFVDERKKEADFSGDGQIDFEEFVEFMTGEKVPGIEELRRGFSTFPRDMNGAIAAEKFVESVRIKFTAGMKMDRIIRSVDKNGDKKLSFSEYVKVMAMPDLAGTTIEVVDRTQPQTPHCFHTNKKNGELTNTPRESPIGRKSTSSNDRNDAAEDVPRELQGRRLSKTLLRDESSVQSRSRPELTHEAAHRAHGGGRTPQWQQNMEAEMRELERDMTKRTKKIDLSAHSSSVGRRMQTQPATRRQHSRDMTPSAPDTKDVHSFADDRKASLAAKQAKVESMRLQRENRARQDMKFEVTPSTPAPSPRRAKSKSGLQAPHTGRSRSASPSPGHRRARSELTKPPSLADIGRGVSPGRGHRRTRSYERRPTWSMSVPALAQNQTTDKERRTIKIAGGRDHKLTEEKEEVYRRMASDFTVAHAAKSGNRDIREAAEQYRRYDSSIGSVRKVQSATTQDQFRREMRRQRARSGGRVNTGELAYTGTQSSALHEDEQLFLAARNRIKRETISALLQQQQDIRSGYTLHGKSGI